MTLIHHVDVLGEPKAYEKVEFALRERNPRIKKEFNPFNYDEISIEATFKDEKGNEVTLPAFWYQDYEIVLDSTYVGDVQDIHGVASRSISEPQGLESVQFLGEAHYRIRFLPENAGHHQYTITVKVNGETVQILEGEFVVQPSQKIYRGRLKVEPKHRRNFIFDDGTLFIPIGQNTCWYTSSSRKTFDYDIWFQKMHEHGLNTTRIWLAPWGFSLHWNVPLGTLDLEAAARLDRVLNLAEKYNLFVMLTLINHGQFSAKVNPLWDDNPWNKANGGIIDKPMEFFTSEEAKSLYKHQLRYIIARWAYCHHIMAWELWNEVSWVDGYLDSDAGYRWHEEMSRFVKSIDPYRHMVTTSFHHEDNEANSINTLDYANPHSYDYTNENFNLKLPNTLERLWQKYKKPILHSEIGINWRSGTETFEEDPQGISLHQQCWAGMMGGGAGGAMNWWWDSFVHPANLYFRFTGASKFSLQMNLIGESYEQLRFDEDIRIDGDEIGILGYRVDNRVYGYLFDQNWIYNGKEVDTKALSVTIPIANGKYTIRLFNTVSGDVKKEEKVSIRDERLTFTIENFHRDLAFIVD